MTLPLTIANPDLQAHIDATPRGMMHWSGSGPADQVCFGCEHFSQRKFTHKAEREAPITVAGACDKWNRYVAAQEGHAIRRRIFDPRTPACSHYKAKQT